MAAIRTHIDKMEVKYESQWMSVRRVKLCGRHDIVNIELTLLGQAADSRPSSKGHPTCPQLRSSPQRSTEWLFIHSWIIEERRRTSICQYNNFRVTIRIPEKMCKQNLLNDSNYRHLKNSSRPSAALLVGTMHQLKNYLFHFMRCHRHIVSTTRKAWRKEELFDSDRCFPLPSNGNNTQRSAQDITINSPMHGTAHTDKGKRQYFILYCLFVSPNRLYITCRGSFHAHFLVSFQCISRSKCECHGTFPCIETINMWGRER